MQVNLCDFGENWHKPEATSGASSNRLLTKLEANTTFSILSHSRKKCQLKHVPHNKLVHNMIIIEVFIPFFNRGGFYEKPVPFAINPNCLVGVEKPRADQVSED